MKHKLPYFIIIASSILLIINLYNYFVNGEEDGFYLRIISNILIIVAMFFSIRARRKQNKN